MGEAANGDQSTIKSLNTSRSFFLNLWDFEGTCMSAWLFNLVVGVAITNKIEMLFFFSACMSQTVARVQPINFISDFLGISLVLASIRLPILQTCLKLTITSRFTEIEKLFEDDEKAADFMEPSGLI